MNTVTSDQYPSNERIIVLIGILLFILLLLLFTSCDATRYLPEQSTFAGYQENSMAKECRHVHPYEKRGPNWYKKHQVKDTFKYPKHEKITPSN
jgi:hypothetical protein